MSWNKILCNNRELQLIGTLNGGQSFRWTHNKDTDEWVGVFNKTVWKLRQSDDFLQYQVLGSLLNKSQNTKINKTLNLKDFSDDSLFRQLLSNYFRLDVNLAQYYKEWSGRDTLFKEVCQQFYGIRMLQQEPVENLFSFICSQNNHISRISSLVEKLCTHYGEEICKVDGVTYYAFPEVDKLSIDKVESELRVLGFGYRAKFIQKSAAQILDWGDKDWFTGLKDMKYKDARNELMKLHGMGPNRLQAHVQKWMGHMNHQMTYIVADCNCLMSLNHLEALPVDTHVYQIAANNYLPHLKGKKSVTEKMYVEIGDHFRSLYGDLAGWAHTVLFCADLKKFKTSDDEKIEGKPSKKRKKT